MGNPSQNPDSAPSGLHLRPGVDAGGGRLPLKLHTMGLHQKIYRWFQRNPRKVDLITMLVWLTFLALPYLFGQLPYFAASVLMILPLAWRRSHPVPATAFLVVVYFFVWLLELAPVPALITAPVMIHAAAAYGPRWAGFAALGAGTLGALLFGLRQPDVSPEDLGVQGWLTAAAIYFVFIELLCVLAWTFGDLQRTRRLQVDALRDRAHRLEIERQQERDLAAADERSHIAREMHDIVAHSLSVIITQADGARYAGAQDPQVALSTLGTIADTGRTSLREMRRLLGVLRSDEAASTRPLPALADVESLVGTVRRTGLEVGCAVEGRPRRSLPAGAELTAYRVVQEALTNVLKHAGPATAAEVQLNWTAKGLELRIDDDGRGADADPATAGAGQGIVGMTERLALYDGSVRAAPRPGGGFRVQAFIPYTEA
jgi:signal transduction histidine kinase